MPKRAQYTLSWSPEQAQYLLTGPENGAGHLVTEESWLAWPEEHHTFAFHGRNGQINLLKEKRWRGGEGYWYAYRRRQGRMVKRYMGLSAQLSIERLEEIAGLLAHRDEGESASAQDAQAEQVFIRWSERKNGRARRLFERPISSAKEPTSDPSPRPEDIAGEIAGRVAISEQFEPLLMPKLQLPRLQKSLLSRERLLELLDKGLEYKVTLITGPAGYGKTTLVNQWISARSTRPAFPRFAGVTLDEDDNDPTRFWRYIIAACQQFQVGLGKEALELLLAHRLPPFKPLSMMLTALLNELSRLEQPGILILDDLHAINSAQVVETLGFFLEHLPTSLHLVMLMRGDPPFPLARLHARNELLDIYPPELGFTLEEARTFLEQELHFTLSPKTLRQIYARMEGWPAGLRLFTRVPRLLVDGEREIEPALSAFAGSFWGIQEYFLNEILHTLPSDQQEFLLQTSVLPRINGSLCDTIMERADSARLIEIFRGGDLFLVPLDGTGEWARYQSLFAEAMQQEARRRLGDEQLRQLAARASTWYEKHGYLAEAIETALNAATFTRAASLIEQFIESKQQGSVASISEVYSMNRWLERLPEKELERSPDLCVNAAMNLLFIAMEGPRSLEEQERIQHLLQVAEQKWRDANNTAKLAEIFAFRALLARQEGRMLQAVTWARQALDWLPEGERTWRNLALSVVGIGETLDGNLANARKFLLESVALSEQQGNRTYARAIKGMLGGTGLEQGELRQAAEQLRQMQTEARAVEDRDDIARTQLLLALIAYQWNNLEEAEQATREALEIGEQMKEEELQALATARLALIEHARGQSAQAEQRLVAWLAQAQAPITPHSYQLLREVQAMLAHIQLANGDIVAAERWFAACQQDERVLPLLQHWREQLLGARLLLARGEVAGAIEQLDSLHTAALRTNHTHFRLNAQVVLILAYARQGKRAKARESLRELLEATRSEGYLRLFLDEGEELATLLRELLPQLREKALLAYARQILSAFAQEIGTETPEIAPGATLLLEPLSQQEQKVLRLLAAGNSNAEIARELVVSVNTVRTQVQSIYRKLNVNNRVEASTLAKQVGLA